MPGRHSIAEARRNLPSLVRDAENGRAVELTRRGEPMAVLIGLREFKRLTSRRRGFGDAYREFATSVGLDGLALDPDELFGDVRDEAPGREVRLQPVKYLLDANTVSEPLRPRPNRGGIRRLRQHEGEIAIPAPVWHELRSGCTRLARSRRSEAIDRTLHRGRGSGELSDSGLRLEGSTLACPGAREADRGGQNAAVCRRTDCRNRSFQRVDPRDIEHRRLSGVRWSESRKLDVRRQKLAARRVGMHV